MMLSIRDRWLVAMLPAIATSVFYIYGSAKTAQSRCDAVRAELQKEQAKPVDFRVFKALGEDYEKNQDAAANARGGALAPGRVEAPRIGSASEDRSDVLRAISNVLKAHGMIQIRSEKEEAGKGAAMPKPMSDAWQPYAEKFHAPAPELWRFELRGAYPQMLSACEELAHSAAFVVPLSITMEPAVKSDAKATDIEKISLARPGDLRWVLTLWL